MRKLTSLKLEYVGQLRCADVTFGDLTVLVGPQATGKSIFLQFLRLALDAGYIHDQLRKHGIEWGRRMPEFLDAYLGEGMRGVWMEGEPRSSVWIDGKLGELSQLATPRRRTRQASVFYIPAQRVLSLARGWPVPFQGFAGEDPFALRDFSETFRLLLEQEFSRTADLFPKTNRLKREYREILSEHIFGGSALAVERHGVQKRLVLKQGPERNAIPFLAWSAGQREFVPLLLGLYWLMPPAKTKRRGALEWVVIEEPEMGLHPAGISAVLLLVLELLWRGYRVCLSSHSPHVLDLAWALRVFRKWKGTEDDVLDLFKVRKSEPMRAVAAEALQKEIRVYYFSRDDGIQTRDISELDPDSQDPLEAAWGGLTEFSGRAADLVAAAVNRRSAL